MTTEDIGKKQGSTGAAPDALAADPNITLTKAENAQELLAREANREGQGSAAEEVQAQVKPQNQPDSASKKTPDKGNAKQSGSGGFLSLVKEVAELIVITLLLLIFIRQFLAEARYIPSQSMEPTLQIDDRLLVEKVSGWLGKPIHRGDILVFYPPPSEMGGKDLSNDPWTVIGRLTGLPCFPVEPAFIKRVIGLPGDRIRVQRGNGVWVNEQLLDESPYVKEHGPNYDLNYLGDIHGRGPAGQLIRPYGDSKDPIIVPPGKLFMMGDNRNNSEDSHVWGFLDQKRVIGRACLLFWRHLQPPKYPRYLDQPND